MLIIIAGILTFRLSIVQFDRSQSIANVASDSSDRSKDKSDQKVYVLNYLHGLYMHFQEGIHDLLLDCTLQTLRRLAQNREAARKSRLRKKVWAYILLHWFIQLLLFQKFPFFFIYYLFVLVVKTTIKHSYCFYLLAFNCQHVILLV